MIGLLLLLLAQELVPKVICTSVGGSIYIGPSGATNVPMKCCPTGSFIDDPKHPTDEKGNLICYREKT